MDPKAVQNFLNNIFSLWLNPEIETRKNNNQTPQSFSLDKAQIIFLVDGKKIIRLNDEIKAVITTNRRVVKDMTVVFDTTDESIEGLERLQEESDFGHVTILKVRDLWVIAFDFRYGISSSKDHFKLGSEFLRAAEVLVSEDKNQAAVSNLFFALENLMKARILLYPDLDMRKTKTHGKIAGRVNVHFKRTQIISDEQREVFNFLKTLYDKGIRYVPMKNLDVEKIKEAIKVVNKFSEDISKLYSQQLIFKD